MQSLKSGFKQSQSYMQPLCSLLTSYTCLAICTQECLLAMIPSMKKKMLLHSSALQEAFVAIQTFTIFYTRMNFD